MSKVGVEDSKSSNDDIICTLKLPEEQVTCKKRIPKRILHFSDGTLEEYSSDEEGSSDSSGTSARQILPATAAHLNWLPWFWYHTVFVGSKALSVCDYLGESLANFFGIISPKYEYEIEQYKRAIAEEEKRRRLDTELGTFCHNETDASTLPIQTEPLRY